MKRISATSGTAGSMAVRIDPAAVPGWAVDADPDNDPTYPYRDRDKDDHSGAWPRPPQQDVTVEVLQSVEHTRRPAVVGTSTPPSGLSGVLRRAAFTKTESNLLHWMLLMAADRINVCEGIAGDLGRGRIPNIPGEMGIRAEWRHNRGGFVTKAAGAIALLMIGRALTRRRLSKQAGSSRRGTS